MTPRDISKAVDKQCLYVSLCNESGGIIDELFKLGEDLNVRAGCPNLIERLESGLLSYGSDIDDTKNPFDRVIVNILHSR